MPTTPASVSLSAVQIADPLLAPARSPEAFALHRAAWEWRIEPPLLVRDESELVAPDQISVTPFAHQVRNLLTFCRRAPVALLADDVGLGKTISAGLILAELIHRRKVRRALVLCPNILLTQWERELTDKFGLPVAIAKGRKLHDAVRIERGVIVTTYETARDQLEVLGDAGIQMLILDEAHRLRRLYGADKAPRVATAVRAALARRWFKYVLMLTATPIQNRVWDLYSLLDLLSVAQGKPNPLGTPEDFESDYIRDGDALDIHPWRLPDFRAHVRGYVARTRRSEAGLVFPDREVWLRRVEASDDERDLVRALGRELDELNPLAQISLAQALMSSPQAFAAQLQNMLPKAGHLRGCLDAAQRVVAEGRPAAKLTGLAMILRDLREARPEGFRLVVFTGRRETQNAIGAFLDEEGIAHGFIRGGCPRENREAIDAFTCEPPEINVLVSTDAGAEGVNLQAANVLVNYDLPWNPMVMEQRIGRVQRLGSPHKLVTVVNLVVRGSVEERIVQRLAKKLDLIAQAAFEIDAILESSSTASKEGDAGENFEEMIGRLVVDSLKGKDVDEAVRREEQSLDEARLLLQEKRQVIDAQLDGLDGLQGAAPAPALPDQPRSMVLEDFVIGALEHDDAVVTEPRPGLFEIEPAAAEPFEAIIGVDARDRPHPDVVIYAPGEPAFETLADRWAAQDGALVYEHRAATDDVLRALAERWCSTIPGAALRDMERLGARTAFQGEVLCAARAVVAHDSYQRLLSVDVLPDGHAKLPEEAPASGAIRAQGVRVGALVDEAATVVAAAARDASGVRDFCRFYARRRDESRAPSEARSEDLFTPTIEAGIVGVRGHQYEVIRLRLAVAVDDGGLYDAEIEVVPATAQITREPAMDMCEQSGRRVPEGWLDTCAISNKRALRHTLRPFDDSGKRALVDHLARSAVTGRTMLKRELAASDVSGVLAEPEELVVSAISQRRGLRSETATCEFTGAVVLVDELVKSDVSGRMLRRDQQAASVISGTIGHVSEFVECEVSSALVLPSETARSDVDGKLFRRDWLVRSDRPPHRVGCGRFLVQRCAKTGRTLLADEMVMSAASWKMVDSTLVEKSEVSDLVALPEEMVVCALSGKRVTPPDTSTCAVTGHLALRHLMVKSAASGRFMLPGQEVQSQLSGLPMAPAEAFQCPWLGILVLPQETATCARTGLRVAKSALNQAGELADLRFLLDNPDRGRPVPELVPWLCRTGKDFLKGATRAAVVEAPSGKLRAVVVKSEWFIFRCFAGCVISGSAADETLALAGDRYTVGFLNLGRWSQKQDVKTAA